MKKISLLFSCLTLLLISCDEKQPDTTALQAYSQNLTVTSGESLDIVLTATSRDDSELSMTVTVEPEHGALSGITPNLTYTPEDDYVGTDSIQFIASNGTIDSDPAIITISVVQSEPVDNNSPSGDPEYRNISLHSSIIDVQPMTGIILWTDHDKRDTDSISLEYCYMKYSDVVASEDVYNWSVVDNLLNQVANHGHQAVLRYYYVYPGYQTTVPNYIKQLNDYSETKAVGDGNNNTWYPDWSHQALKDFTLDFYTKFAQRYDNDPRLAFLEVGFGLWAEYHIYDGPMNLGQTFPSIAFQTTFIQHLDQEFNKLHWIISIDASDDQNTPFAHNSDLLDINFGIFDDSFMNADFDNYNKLCFEFFGMDRYAHSPVGGEFSYYTNHDQQTVLSPNGAHGISFETFAANYHVTFIIGNDQPSYQTMERIKEASMATGYKFEIVEFKSSSVDTKVKVKNNGVAPIYYDAYVSVNGVNANASLKGLLPGKIQEFSINLGSQEGDNLQLRIECDRLVNGQQIQFDADL